MAGRTSTRLHPEPRGGSRIWIWHLEHSLSGEDGGCGDYVGGPEFRDIAERLRVGLSYQPWTAGLMKKRKAEVGRDDPAAESRPAGAVRLLTSPPPRRIIETPSAVVIVSERDVTYRQISTDGRPLPKDASPSPSGYSTGRCQGNRLMVETEWPSRWHLAGPQRQSADGRGQADRAIPARELRTPGNRAHDR
jgi:hypothetical protein